MDEHAKSIAAQLEKHGLRIPLRHFSNAHSAAIRNEFEAARGELRNFVEGLFEALCQRKTKQKKRRGEARKVLEAAGVLTEDEWKAVRGALALLQDGGGHAGSATEFQYRAASAMALGVAEMALACFPPTLDANAAWKTIQGPNGPVTENMLDIVCPTCKHRHNLATTPRLSIGDETHYSCIFGCQTVLIISPLDNNPEPWPDRGYVFGPAVFRNAGDVYLRVNHFALRGSLEGLVNACPNALRTRRKLP